MNHHNSIMQVINLSHPDTTLSTPSKYNQSIAKSNQSNTLYLFLIHQHLSKSTTDTLTQVSHLNCCNSFQTGVLVFSALPPLPINLPRAVTGNANLVTSHTPAHALNILQGLGPEPLHGLQHIAESGACWGLGSAPASSNHSVCSHPSNVPCTIYHIVPHFFHLEC